MGLPLIMTDLVLNEKKKKLVDFKVKRINMIDIGVASMYVNI